MKDELATCDEPADLCSLISLAIRVDNRLREQRLETTWHSAAICVLFPAHKSKSPAYSEFIAHLVCNLLCLLQRMPLSHPVPSLQISLSFLLHFMTFGKVKTACSLCHLTGLMTALLISSLVLLCLPATCITFLGPKESMEKYIKDSLAAGIIHPSSSPLGVRFFSSWWRRRLRLYVPALIFKV